MLISKLQRSLQLLLHSIFIVLVVCSSIWMCLALWFQQPLGLGFSLTLIIGWIIFACSILGLYFKPFLSRKKDVVIYLIVFSVGYFWYLSLAPNQNRDWDPEVAQLLSFEQKGDQVILHNVRNFQWNPDGSYQARWESRHVNLNDITGVNVITSYWMGPQIAHTLLSFDFKDQAPITFSIEIRKEKHEAFSTLGGFFRRYELSLIAADEKDIIYTRSQIRGEQVYFFPIEMNQTERRALFEEYLAKANALQQSPRWYNTLTSNCTTLVFDMVQAVTASPLPLDYRLIASGYLPNYLHDLGVLDPRWDIHTWYQHAHVNPKIPRHHTLSSAQYSALLRQGLVP